MRTMTPHRKHVAQIKLNGKKSCPLNCGCCIAENRKEESLKSLVAMETAEEIRLFGEDQDSA